MRRIPRFALLAVILLSLAVVANAQCWSATADENSSVTSNMRPSDKDAREAVLMEFETKLQSAMGLTSKVYMTETGIVRSDPDDGNVYFGKQFVTRLDKRYTSLVEMLGGDVVPIGLKMVLAHEYAHQFQFRMFRKRKIAITAPTPAVELQADLIASYVLRALLDAQYSKLPREEKSKKILADIGGAMLVVAELGDQYFNDANHHGDPSSRRAVVTKGYEAAEVNKFGSLLEALTTREDELYDWSLQIAEYTFKHQIKGSTF